MAEEGKASAERQIQQDRVVLKGVEQTRDAWEAIAKEKKRNEETQKNDDGCVIA